MRFRPTRFSLFCFLTIRITVEKGEIRYENSGTIVSQSSHGLPFATIDRSNLELGVCVSRACSIFNPNCLLNEQARWRGEGGGRKGREKILKKRVRNAFRAFFFFKSCSVGAPYSPIRGEKKKNEHFLRKRSYLFLFFTTNKRNSDFRGVSFGVSSMDTRSSREIPNLPDRFCRVSKI